MMNQTQKESKKLTSVELYEQLIKISKDIAHKLSIPSQWIFIYLLAKNWDIGQFDNELKRNQIYIPNKNQASKIFVGNETLKCSLCQRKKKVMVRNICEHYFCYKCLRNYIFAHYSNDQIKKPVLPLCLFYEQCSQIISNNLVDQILVENQELGKRYKKSIVQCFIRNQNEKQTGKLKHEELKHELQQSK